MAGCFAFLSFRLNPIFCLWVFINRGYIPVAARSAGLDYCSGLCRHSAAWWGHVSQEVFSAHLAKKQREKGVKMPGFPCHHQGTSGNHFLLDPTSKRAHCLSMVLQVKDHAFNTWAFGVPKVQTIAPAICGFSSYFI